MAFYTEQLPHCQQSECQKPATHEVKSSGTVSYGKFCKSHAEKRVKELEKTWERRKPQ